MQGNAIMPKLNGAQTSWVPQAWEKAEPGSGTPTVTQDTDANAVLVATVPAPAAGSGQSARLASIFVSGLGVTVAAVVNATITGAQGGTFAVPIPILAGVTLAITPFALMWPVPLLAAAPETAITVTVDAFGLGNTSANLMVTGLQA